MNIRTQQDPIVINTTFLLTTLVIFITHIVD